MDAGAAKDRRLSWESQLLEKLDHVIDRCSPESHRRSSKNPYCTLIVEEDSDSRRRYPLGSRNISDYGSLESG